MKDSQSFENEAKAKQASLGAEALQYLRESKKYWLVPILVLLIMLGALIVLGGTSAAPFIYSLF